MYKSCIQFYKVRSVTEKMYRLIVAKIETTSKNFKDWIIRKMMMRNSLNLVVSDIN